MNTKIPTFSKQDSLKFFRTLNSRVNAYFKENNIDKSKNVPRYTSIMIYCLSFIYFSYFYNNFVHNFTLHDIMLEIV